MRKCVNLDAKDVEKISKGLRNIESAGEGQSSMVLYVLGNTPVDKFVTQRCIKFIFKDSGVNVHERAVLQTLTTLKRSYSSSTEKPKPCLESVGIDWFDEGFTKDLIDTKVPLAMQKQSQTAVRLNDRGKEKFKELSKHLKLDESNEEQIERNSKKYAINVQAGVLVEDKHLVFTKETELPYPPFEGLKVELITGGICTEFDVVGITFKEDDQYTLVELDDIKEDDENHLVKELRKDIDWMET